MSDHGRMALGVLALSAAGLVTIVGQEGYSDRAIIPVKGDVPTLGFGTTQGVKMGDRTTPPKALARALSDINQFEGAVKACVSVPLHQYEYDAYVSMTYNVGAGAFCRSRLVKKLNAFDYEGACKEILNWRYFQTHDCSAPENKKLCGGLWSRRQAEYQTCIGGEK